MSRIVSGPLCHRVLGVSGGPGHESTVTFDSPKEYAWMASRPKAKMPRKKVGPPRVAYRGPRRRPGGGGDRGGGGARGVSTPLRLPVTLCCSDAHASADGPSGRTVGTCRAPRALGALRDIPGVTPHNYITDMFFRASRTIHCQKFPGVFFPRGLVIGLHH